MGKSEIEKMIKMEEILDYILEHIREEMTLKQVAEHFKYNTAYFAKIFREYFESPFLKFVNQLKMRCAAEELLRNKSVKGSWKNYGYGKSSNFSKAFHKEFGTSPREFIKSTEYIPDMPERQKLFGNEIAISYVETDVVTIVGHLIAADWEDIIDWAEEVAYTVDYPDSIPDLLCEEEKFGMWWHDGKNSFSYLWGRAVKPNEVFSEKTPVVDILGGNYAVFSFKRCDDNQETEKVFKMLARYIFKEWKVLNHKLIDTMGFTYVKLDKERGYIYVPMLQGMYGHRRISTIGHSIDTWTTYIDEHIQENLAIKGIAERMNYSEKSFREVFQMYYNMSPTTYILRRRLYLAAGKIQESPGNAEEILSEYSFKSKEVFEELFCQEFGVSSEKSSQVKFEVVDLAQYHLEYKADLDVTFQIVPKFKMLGKSIKEKQQGDTDTIDIPGLAAYWFQQEFDCLEHTRYVCYEQEKKNKVALWDEICGKTAKDTRYEYVLGPIVEEIKEIPIGMKAFDVGGGKYAIFKTRSESDIERLAEIFRMMTRCVFYGWIKENRERLDIERITFVQYRNKKLYFYVPIH